MSIILGEILLKIITKNLSIVLKLHQSGVKDTFGKFSAWINEGVDDMKFPKDVCEKVSKLIYIWGAIFYVGMRLLNNFK